MTKTTNDKLRSVTRPLEPGPPIDVLSFGNPNGLLFANDRIELAGVGTALRVTLPSGTEDLIGVQAAQESLGLIPSDDTVQLPGTGVIAFGALPFDRGASAELLVPAIAYGRDPSGAEWVTIVSTDPPSPERFSRQWLIKQVPTPSGMTGQALEVSGTPWETPRVTTLPEPEAYAEAVKSVVATIASGVLEKAVIARALSFTNDSHLRAGEILSRLYEQDPWSTAFYHSLQGGGAFVGVSPELIVSRRGPEVSSHPIAGTIRLGPGEGGDGLAAMDLLASEKDRIEHELVVTEVAARLRPLCEVLEVPTSPSVVSSLRTMAHLSARISGTLIQQGNSIPGALELMAILHPTPAVAGVPCERALEMIAEHEPLSRGNWAGPVGWIDASGDGDWVIGIRSAIVSDNEVVLWAGAGIVAQSDAQAELEETTLKLRPLVGAAFPGFDEIPGF